MKAAIIMGSTSDLAKVEPAVGILKDYGVEVTVRCLSAHRAHADKPACALWADKHRTVTSTP